MTIFKEAITAMLHCSLRQSAPVLVALDLILACWQHDALRPYMPCVCLLMHNQRTYYTVTSYSIEPEFSAKAGLI